MNKLAAGLNESRDGTVINRILSDFGKRFYFPKGIASQAAEAGRHANLYNATIGMAKQNGGPMMPEACGLLLPELSAAEVVEYAPNGGVAELRELWTNEMLRKNPNLMKEISEGLEALGQKKARTYTLEELFNPCRREINIQEV